MAPRVLALLPVTLLSPATARACGTCVDVGLLHWQWWTPAVGFLAAALALEGLGFAVLRRVARLPVRGHGRLLLWTIVPAIGGIALSGGSAYGFLLGVALGLGVRFVRQVREGVPHHPRLHAARVVLVVLAVAAGTFSLRPAARPTAWLVSMVDGLLHRHEAPAHLVPKGWAVRELTRRDDAEARLLERLEKIEPPEGTYHRDRGRALRLLRAHAIVGGDDARRFAECARLGVDASWGALMRGAHAVRVCGAEAPAPAPLANRN